MIGGIWLGPSWLGRLVDIYRCFVDGAATGVGFDL